VPHFFINSKEIQDGNAVISGKENYNHIAKSLRAKTGERLLLLDENKIQYETVITEITNSKITAQIQKSYPSFRFLDFTLDLAQSPVNNDGQNFIIEKSTELGVSCVFPVLTDHCVLKHSVIEKKIPKWQRIMYESTKQCERAEVPVCCDVTTIEQIAADKSYDKIIVFCERIAAKTIRESFKESPVKKGGKILVIVGPEGGFSDREFGYFENMNFEMLTLGNLILRAETAVTVGLGNIIYEYSNFSK